MKQARHKSKKSDESLERGIASGLQPDELKRQHSLLHLQRRAGNQAVVGLLESRGQLQTKLRDDLPADEYELEADEAAAQAPLSSAPVGMVQRKPKIVGAAIAPHIQRSPRNGDSPGATTPETEADPATAGPLIVEDDNTTLGPGQMRKSEFLEQLRSTVCSTADEALKEAGQSSEGCPYIEKWLAYYEDQPPVHIERALRKYAPEAASATSAHDYIPAVSNRVRRAVDTWAKTGEITGVPDELKHMLTGPGAALGAVAGALESIGSAIGGAISAAAGAIGSAFSSIGKALFKRKEGHAESTDDPQEIQAQLRGGQPLDDGAKSRMGAAFGHDFSAVRVHTNAEAAGLSDELNARAFTVGSDIAFGAGEYQPGTLIGDALIAHELAHVVQQGGGHGSSSPQSKGAGGDEALEEDADMTAVGAVVSAWGSVRGAVRDIGRSAAPRLRSGLRLQSCKKYVTNRGLPRTTRESGRDTGVLVRAGTPRRDGTISSVDTIEVIPKPDLSEAEADAYLKQRGLLSKVTKLGPPSNEYNCHGYTFLGGAKWMDDDQVPMILWDNGYKVTTTPVVGDILIYWNNKGISHSATVTEVSGTSVTKVTSKWGPYGLYSHAPDDIPPEYGKWEVRHSSRPGGNRLRYE